ncbi:2-C-methyl-D-erythritol 2,4-cyclodiphosphate synthase [Aminiphilus sp.]|jgi:2-C-methyl-D-erythritol 4-phosphate cytidylyltransferase/2-C-methyl-D-erythritol 2,4-cyclodiphosphate synthase|uniref:2-C-methyl-D-erythritol 2,4-cyclodiphosphate synthase n=1 Tax=Aminiphilus sp. TaxID=1872488 RepID=UPI00260C29BA|nr:2-C-methyl-D-erythritol 2,4-cyclodiphosphate synthase [Aminiphilus sp.]
MDASFIIVASGKGTRMGGTPKQFCRLGSMPMWRWSAFVANALFLEGIVGECVLVIPEGKTMTSDVDCFEMPLRFAPGGMERADSVLSGLREASGEMVLVHDAARPFVSTDLCRRLLLAAGEGGAVPVLPETDALKRISEAGEVMPVSREGLFRTQTPQVFPRHLLLGVLERAERGAKDEAEAWIAAGMPLTTVPGERKNFKITYEEDMTMAQMLARAQAKDVLRTGHGYDVHPLVPHRPLLLAGVRISSALGLQGHSDADVIAHSVADALLGAAGEQDLGTLFPASEERYRNADSMLLLDEVCRRIFSRAWIVEWVDVTLIAQVPRLGAFVPEIESALNAVFNRVWKENSGGKTNRCVHVKVKSGEHVGSVGRGEAMVCHAVATLRRFENEADQI